MGTARKERATDRVAVIDIGSNSVRLVVFDALRRVPVPLFNEKVICALGAGLAEGGRLTEESMERALVNLARFVRMAAGMGVRHLHLLATAAAREAENGPAFVAEVEARCGHPVKLLSGAEEARVSALGVHSAFPHASGLMGDLGGGSLELVALKDGRATRSATLPLGLLRLPANAKAGAVIDTALRELEWLGRVRAPRVYAVGGAWRALARVHMAQTGYPLRVIHGYTIRDPEGEGVLALLQGLSSTSLSGIQDVPRERLRTLPMAALVLRRILRRLGAPDVVFSSYGLREGYLFDLLDPETQKEDPLIAAVAEMALREGRFGDHGEAIARWMAPLFAGESSQESRLRRAACHLSDLAWREHPDYRAEQAMSRILHYPFTGLDHGGLAFLAYAVFCRYGGSFKAPEAATALALLTPGAARRARQVGLAMRLAFTLSAGMLDLLGQTRLALADGMVRLSLPSDGAVLHGEAVERRFAALTKALEVSDYRIETV